MEFYLKYDGPLPPNGNTDIKHRIREEFRSQMKNLWTTVPLNEQQKLLKYPPGTSDVSVIKEIEGIRFAPLVTKTLFLTCEIDIVLLWKDEPGNIINNGDIDNRLKTLFDSLACPNKLQMGTHKTDIQKHQPYHVLLEDDKLITSIRTVTNKLLLPTKTPDEVSLLIKVITKPYSLRYCNMF